MFNWLLKTFNQENKIQNLLVKLNEQESIIKIQSEILVKILSNMISSKEVKNLVSDPIIDNPVYNNIKYNRDLSYKNMMNGKTPFRPAKIIKEGKKNV